MIKCLEKRFISFLLSVAILVTALPVTTYAAEENPQGTATYSEKSRQSLAESQEKSLEYAMNGGSFREGYLAPASYPVAELPDWKVIDKPGYSFAGWYDNEALTGDAITSVSDADYAGTVVLYAKWTDRCYYVDIPTSLSADGSELALSGKADGLYEDDRVRVSIRSENDWNLKDGRKSLPYELRDRDTNVSLQNDALVMSLSHSQKSDERAYVCNVTQQPEVTGNYTDTLTFQVAFDSKKYTIEYQTNGGFMDNPDAPGELMVIESDTLAAGTVLNALPTAIKPGYTFLGWCYDESCTRYVASTDRLLGNLTLYASFTKNQQLESHTIATFARAIDVDGASFVVQVTDQSGTFTTDQILSACTLTNISDFTDDVTLNITAAGENTYTIIKATGWKEGSSYKLVLNQENLYFTGFDSTIREYEIVIHKEEVENVELNRNLRYINRKDLSNLVVNGQSVSSLSIATMTIGMNGEVQSQGSNTIGSFTYGGKTLQVGDQIAVYSGDVIPTMNGISSSTDGGDISFLEITGVNGNNYTYRGSDTEDVLFMPEVLPLDVSKDQDGDASNHSVTVNVSDLTFGENELSRRLQLDEDTTVDEGDFLALYTSDSGTPDYGKIIDVEMADGKYIITYQPVSWEEVQAAMDVYRTEAVDGEELLEDTDVLALQEDIEKQAVESGFADEVADQIAQMAMRTDSFAELQKNIEEELGAQARITTYAGRAGKAGKPSRVEVGTPQVRADLDTRLRHFDGDLSGVHLGLEISVPITFHVARYADFEITVKATFEQEVRVGIQVDGEAVWKVWGIFPYIADYRVTASLDLYEYTGIGLDVNFKTAQGDNPTLPGSGGSSSAQYQKKAKLASNVSDIVEELQSMMEDGKEYISDKAPLLAKLGSSEGEEISVARSLAERYADLLEDESDWVEIYTKRLIAKHIRIILVIDIAIELDFVVSANVNISMGMTFWYKNAKRYVFCLQVKGRKATSDTINITEEQYEFTAYAMGTLGIKAGVRLTVRVGLLSTELASVGLSADVGGYVQLWGYLYYQYQYTASKGRSSKSMGALYLEVGIYLEIKFRAQALANSFTYSPTLYEAMWPLYTVGTLENVMDFTYDEEISYNLKREMKTIRLSDDFFTMNYMDMKEGLDDGNYFTKVYEDDSDQYFIIGMTNDSFTYDPATNLITVDPKGAKSVDGEMVITWKNQPGTFQTKPFQKKIKLHWDELKDGYFIAFLSNGGNYVNPICQKYDTKVTAPAKPVRQGYEFAGWYEDEALTKKYTIPTKMPDRDAIVYAKWNPAKVSYTVKNYVEGTNGIYELSKEDIIKKRAATGSQVSPIPADKSGFGTPNQKTATVEADGSTVIEYYYPRNKYTATYKSEGEVISSGAYRYGTMMPVPAVYKVGYEFKGWIQEGASDVSEVPMLVPAQDRTYHAKWEPLTDMGYTVKYYVQEENGNGYTLHQIQYLTGKTGETVTASAGGYDTAVYHIRDHAELPSGEIAADGSLELKVYYDLNTYKITYNKMAEDALFPEECELMQSARCGQKVAAAIPSRGGYQFKGWYLDDKYQIPFDNTMPGQDITLYAKWEKIQVNYTVRHYQANLPIFDEYGMPESGQTTTYTLVEEETFTAPMGDTVVPDVKDYPGFLAPAVEGKTVTADHDGKGTLVIDYRYERQEYTLVWAMYEEMVPETMLYGAPLVKPDGKEAATDERRGYRVKGWFQDTDLKVPFTGDTMPAHDLILYPEWEPIEIAYYVSYEFWRPDGKGGYAYYDSYTDTFTGLADSVISPPEVKTFTGYTFDEAGRLESFQIKPNDPQVTYVYKANMYTFTYQYMTNEGLHTEPASHMLYGQEITLPEPERDGFAFAGWYTDANFETPFTESTMPDHDLTLYGKWVDGKQSYQVVHYLTELDGSLKLLQTENLYGDPEEEVTPSTKAPVGFESVAPITHKLVQGSVENNKIIYVYPRKNYEITYHLNGGTYAEGTQRILPYGADLSGEPYRPGYDFAGWYVDEALQTLLAPSTVPAYNLTLYAKWVPYQSSYLVEHYLQSSDQDDYHLFYREYLTADTDSLVEPEVKQYTGYESPAKQQGTVVANDNGDRLVIQYRYTCKNHQLTLHDVCRDELTVEDLIDQKKYGSSIPDQHRRGYIFNGWYKDAAYADSFTGTMPDEDLELYAKWTPMQLHYTLTYWKQDLNGWYRMEEIVSDTAPTDSFITPTVTEQTGFTLPEVEPLQIRADRVNELDIKYPRNRHTVTFRLENGEADVVKKGYYGSQVTAPVPKREGYTFIGWDGEVVETIPDTDLIYTARWKVNSYLLSFAVDGDITEETKDAYVDKVYQYGQRVETPVKPTKRGYTFEGWSTAVPAAMPDHNIHLVALWKPVTYSISCDLNGGDYVYNESTYRYDSSEIVLNPPKRAHYIFKGWSGTELKGIQKTVTIPTHSIGNRSYTAHWEEKVYTVQFVPLIGCIVENMEPLKLIYDQRVRLPKCNYTLDGHTFVGWSKTEKAPSTHPEWNYSDQQEISHLDSDLTLYPVYRINQYRVEFNYNKNEGILRQYNYRDYGSYVGFPRPTPGEENHKWGYNLVGWEKSGNGGYVSAVGDKAVKGYVLRDTEDVVWKAWWEPNNRYEYTPSNAGNVYDITDGKNREISFTFHVDGKQTREAVTGDCGLGNGADYVLNMDNMSYDLIHSNYKKMKVSISYKVEMVHDGYAVMKLSYKTADGKNHSWKKESSDLLDKNQIKKFSYELDCKNNVDVKSIKIEFDADGGKIDEYLLSKLNVTVEFE